MALPPDDDGRAEEVGVSDVDHWKQVKSIFDAAVACEGEMRAAVLRIHCGEDRALHDDVESLLAADRDRKSLLDEPVPPAIRGLVLAAMANGNTPDARDLAPGTQLGPYTLIGILGAGGMGEVYRAQDTVLGRQVAIKILPSDWVATPEHCERFEREARLLATLNHPNIGAIYGVVDSDGIRGLVLELVDGETLGDRIARERSASRGLRLRDALNIARQIAEGLEAAHERGIVHRDLKPANIKINADGRVKLLDFGLATLAREAPATGGDVEKASAPPDPLGASALFGTIPYMSPEQARGEPVDRRTDVWAFGCVLYEMLTGERAFDGAGSAQTLDGVLHRDPDFSRVPLDVSSVISRLMARCLEKERTKRLPQIAVARFQIEEVTGDASVPADSLHAWAKSRLVQALAFAAALGTLGGLTLAWFGLSRSASATSPLTRLLVDIAPADQIGGTDGRPTRTAFALSPDGMTLVFSAVRANRRTLYVRRLDRTEALPLEGTRGGENPFFSPDGQWIGYWADGAIRKVPVSGGPPVTVTEASLLYGASWGDDDRIVFSGGAGLMEAPATGGAPTALTAVNAANGEVGHRLPRVLPGSDAVLFTITRNRFPRWDETQIAVYSRRTGTTRLLVAGGADARYASSGHLVYVREGLLLAVPFARQRLEVSGGPVGIIADVMQAAYFRGTPSDTGAGQFAISENGTLVYMPGGTAPPLERSVVRVDRSGRSVTLPLAPRPFATLRLSPDGERVALNTFGRERDVWLYSMRRGTVSRLTADGRKGAPVWTPDGEHLTYGGGTSAADALHSIRADGAGSPEQVVREAQDLVPATWTPDARQLIYYTVPPLSIRVHDSAAQGPPATIPAGTGSAMIGGADLSPDGRWIAYHSDESGRPQVYVQAYPGGAPRHQISPDGGTSPVWRRDGRELFYIREDPAAPRGQSTEVTMMVVQTSTKPAFTFGAPRELFTGRYAVNRPARAYDVTADGRHFLLLESRERPSDRITHINVVQNWFEELRRLVRVDGSGRGRESSD
jgi:Tol biopolymer transport system component